ncbi:ABC transporter ATP-binding protein [Spiroplasma sp. TIUS-1]|uniref:ATP-binding cassette domain-containing protein n=1 Tax=Spiroplasma sp. TIUS-1 TaxID=216963 RepID=UPI001398CBF2|nr:ABC transporter ATP-binding protein [Spiroplasma sp. TIUS-1]QHX35629.1 ABC transporter ATP-binding protein [Spiroplasma sp. TIUS-1]
MEKIKLKIESVTKIYNRKTILEDLDLELESGNIYGLLGNNGVGKTTLTKVIFQETSIKTGKISLNGVEKDKINFSEWFYFSESGDLPKNMKSKDYVDYIAMLSMMPQKIFINRYSKASQIVDISSYLDKKISSLSGGEKKLLVLFVCLLLKPKIIFFDEPTANVDVDHKNKIIEAMLAFKNEGTIIVIITHLIDEVNHLLDRVLILDSGKIVYDEPHDKVSDLKKLYKETAKKTFQQEMSIEELLNEDRK